MTAHCNSALLIRIPQRGTGTTPTKSPAPVRHAFIQCGVPLDRCPATNRGKISSISVRVHPSQKDSSCIAQILQKKRFAIKISITSQKRCSIKCSHHQNTRQWKTPLTPSQKIPIRIPAAMRYTHRHKKSEPTRTMVCSTPGEAPPQSPDQSGG